MSTDFDDQLETGVRHIREAFHAKVAARDAEVQQLRTQLARRDTKIDELHKTVTQLEHELSNAHLQIAELTKNMSKLAHFKKQIVETLDEDDVQEVKKVKPPAPTVSYKLPRQESQESNDDALLEQMESMNRPAGNTGNSNTSTTSATVVDGRSFFKSARAQLPYDKYSALLWHVKSYNNRAQSRHRTLESVQELLGREHRSLYERFAEMLS